MGLEAPVCPRGGRPLSWPSGLNGRKSESFQCVFMKQRKQGLSKFRRDFVVRVKDSGSRVAVINETELFH